MLDGLEGTGLHQTLVEGVVPREDVVQLQPVVVDAVGFVGAVAAVVAKEPPPVVLLFHMVAKRRGAHYYLLAASALGLNFAQVWSLAQLCWLLTIEDQCKKSVFLQTYYQGSCQLSWALCT